MERLTGARAWKFISMVLVSTITVMLLIPFLLPMPAFAAKPPAFRLLDTEILPLGDSVIRNLALSDNSNYLYQTHDVFRVWDLADPELPVLVSDNLSVPAIDLRVSGNYTFINRFQYNRINVIDASDPENPEVVAIVVDNTTLDSPHGSYLLGDYLYVAAYGDGEAGRGHFTIVDITDPLVPEVVGFIQSDNWTQGAHDVVVSDNGTYAYLSSHYAEFSPVVIDISDPENPEVVGVTPRIDETELAGIIKKGDTIFVGNSYKLYAYDVSDPTNPTLLGSVGGGWLNPPYSDTYRMSFWGDDYIVGAGRTGVSLIDISDPANMTIIDEIVPEYTGDYLGGNDCLVFGDYVYVDYSEWGTATDARMVVLVIETLPYVLDAFPGMIPVLRVVPAILLVGVLGLYSFIGVDGYKRQDILCMAIALLGIAIVFIMLPMVVDQITYLIFL